MTEDPGQNGPLLQALRERLAVEELHVVLPLSASAFDEVVVRTGGRPPVSWSKARPAWS